jgi:hypothetical protein
VRDGVSRYQEEQPGLRPPALQLHATSPQPDPEAQRAAGKALTVPRSLPQAPAIDVLLPTLAIASPS